MTAFRFCLLQLAIATVLSATTATVFAAGPPPLPGQQQGARQAAQDPPSRVGRLAFVNGGVDLYNERMGDWAQAPLNTPITSRTALWADGNSRAEVRVGSTVIRLDSNTQANFQQLDDQHTTVDVARGSVSLRLRNWQSNERVVLLAGGAQLQIDNVGFYRVDFAPQNNSLSVRVMQGAATLSFGSQRYTVQGGQQLAVDLSAQQITAQFDAQRGEFERWAELRDRGWDSMPSARYVSQEMTGIESLDTYGSWSTDSTYGAVWTPRVVSANWAPYRYGHWSYVNPWGWTWVDDAPWGYAPFHYGRWVFLGGTWGWAPGQRTHRPVWAPALVGFYGNSGNISFSITSGAAPVVGWFPLGPGEVWRPGYRHSDTYIRNVNINNVTNITNVTNVYNGSGTPSPNGAFPDVRNPVAMAGGERFRYAQTAFAATVVPQAAFAAGKPIAAAYAQVQPAQLAAVPIAGTAVKPLFVPSASGVGPGSFSAGGLSAPSAPMANAPGGGKPMFAPSAAPAVFGNPAPLTPTPQQAQQIMNTPGGAQVNVPRPGGAGKPFVVQPSQPIQPTQPSQPFMQAPGQAMNAPAAPQFSGKPQQVQPVQQAQPVQQVQPVQVNPGFAPPALSGKPREQANAAPPAQMQTPLQLKAPAQIQPQQPQVVRVPGAVRAEQFQPTPGGKGERRADNPAERRVENKGERPERSIEAQNNREQSNNDNRRERMQSKEK